MAELADFDLDDIGDALGHQRDYEQLWLLDPQTNKTVFWTSDTGIDGQNPVDLDELDMIPINPLPSYVWHSDMVDFIDTLSDDQDAGRLARAIDGKGAFRRFRAQLEDEYPHLVSVWHSFRDNRARCRAVEWLVENSLIDDETGYHYIDGHPDPDLP